MRGTPPCKHRYPPIVGAVPLAAAGYCPVPPVAAAAVDPLGAGRRPKQSQGRSALGRPLPGAYGQSCFEAEFELRRHLLDTGLESERTGTICRNHCVPPGQYASRDEP